MKRPIMKKMFWPKNGTFKPQNGLRFNIFHDIEPNYSLMTPRRGIRCLERAWERKVLIAGNNDKHFTSIGIGLFCLVTYTNPTELLGGNPGLLYPSGAH